ncbi:Imm1 family immunity protein [Longispora sp. K20-0274]|uniref:Imm1 family immunity protein n=1 Tax=Longispora sp. K20-0274 TaxID=3088255 RepID=UPI0039995E95
MVWTTVHDLPLAGLEDALAQFDERSSPWGVQFTMIYGPLVSGLTSPDEWADRALEVHVDFDAGRAAVVWLPDGTHGVEFDVVGPIVAGLGDEPEEIPAELARVSIDKAREVVREYVSTGAKPTCVEWGSE